MKKMKRAVVVVLDGCGVGASPDAHKYGDAGCNTLLNVWNLKKPDWTVHKERGME